MAIIKVEQLPYENNQNYIYRALRQSILSLDLEPGSGISETELANVFNISRSPIRGALSRLNEENLVKIEPQRKTIVSPLDPEFITQASFTRNLIETELVCEIIRKGKSEELSKKLRASVEEMKTVLVTGGIENKLNYYEVLLKDIAFHSSIYSVAGREKLLSCLRFPYLHYNRFQSLHLRWLNNKDSTVPHHMELVRLIEEKNYKGIIARRDQSIKRVDDILKKSIASYPGFFA